MSEPFVGEIRKVGFNFAPRGWALCDGQLLAVSQNDALFSLLGTIYGGDGRTTFGLPDIRGRAVVHPGSGPGLSTRRLGQKSGAENVTLTVNQLPSHNHTMHAENKNADQLRPTGRLLGVSGMDVYVDADAAANVTMDGGSIGNNGGSRSHANMQPWLAVNYCIALVGIYPSRN